MHGLISSIREYKNSSQKFYNEIQIRHEYRFLATESSWDFQVG